MIKRRQADVVPIKVRSVPGSKPRKEARASHSFCKFCSIYQLLFEAKHLAQHKHRQASSQIQMWREALCVSESICKQPEQYKHKACADHGQLKLGRNHQYSLKQPFGEGILECGAGVCTAVQHGKKDYPQQTAKNKGLKRKEGATPRSTEMLPRCRRDKDWLQNSCQASSMRELLM